MNRNDTKYALLIILSLFLFYQGLIVVNAQPSIYIQTATSNPAITLPYSVPSCTANFIGGSCQGNDVITGNNILNANLYIIGNFIDNSGTLTTNGFVIIATQTFNSIGSTIYAGILNNAGPGNPGNLPLSYGGSGGGGFIGGTNGGNTLIAGGIGGGSATSGNTPNPPTITSANIVSWLDNGMTNYLGGAGGGGDGVGSSGGGGSYGMYLEGNDVLLGTVNSVGGIAQAYANGGGGGGGGIIVIANGIGGFTAGTAVYTGGASGAGAGNGGNGNIIRYQFSQAPPFPEPMFSQYYPLEFYNQTGQGSYVFSINSISNGILTQGPQNQASLYFVPPSNQPTGFYVYNILITNTVSSTTSLMQINISINMTDILGTFTTNTICSEPAIEYFPNCLLYPFASNSFTIKPSTWTIQSDILQNSAPNKTGSNYNLLQFSNANLTFYPKIFLSYAQFSPAITFIANGIDNPIAAASITQTKFKFISSNSLPATPYVRKISNISSYSMQTTTQRINSSTYVIQSDLFNNYSIINQTTPFVGNNFQVYMPEANYINPSLFQSALTTFSSNSTIFSTLNNYCPASVNTISAYRTFSSYLAPASPTGSLYTFSITSGYNNAGIGDFMQIESGTSNLSAIQVEQYKIVSSPGFALPLVNGGVYSFRFLGPNCNFIYATNYSVPSNPINIEIPINTSVPNFIIPNVSIACTQTVYPGNVANVLCTGDDYNNKIYSWRLQQYNVSVASGWIITNTIWINGTNSFTHLYISLSSLNAQKIVISGYAPFGFAVSYTFLLNQNTLQSGFGVLARGLITLLFLLVGLGIVFGAQQGGSISEQYLMSTTLIIEAFMLSLSYLLGVSTFIPAIGMIPLILFLIFIGIQAHMHESRGF